MLTVSLNAATASYLYVSEWAGPSPLANHASPKVTFTQLDFDQFAKYIRPTRSTNYSATFTRGRGKWTLPATLHRHAVHLIFGLWSLRCNSHGATY